MSCFVCDSAKVNFTLREDNDLGYHSVGLGSNDFRIMIGSGDGKPVRIIAERRMAAGWSPAAIYYPQFCPCCGRRLFEYDVPIRGDVFVRRGGALDD